MSTFRGVKRMTGSEAAERGRGGVNHHETTPMSVTDRTAIINEEAAASSSLIR